MEFSLFTWFNALPGKSHAESIDWGFKEVEMAEEMGWDAVWLPQSRFAAKTMLLSSPFVLATAAAMRTKRIKIGLAIHQLGLPGGEAPRPDNPEAARRAAAQDMKAVPQDPLETAEAAATVDQVSRGRFIYGAGGRTRGDPERQRRLYEFLDVLKKAWEEEEFPGYQGEFYKYPRNPGVVPKPYRKSIPISLAADTQASFPVIGEKGYQILIGGGTSHNARGEMVLIQDVKKYREAWRAAGHRGESSIVVRIPTHIAETKEQAMRDVEATMRRAMDTSSYAAFAAPPGTASAETTDKVNMFGTAEEAVERIHGFREEMGADEIMFETNYYGQIPTDRVMNSMRLLTEKVIPKFK